MNNRPSKYYTPSDEAMEEAKVKVVELTQSMTPILREWMPDSGENLPSWILDLPPDMVKDWSTLIDNLGQLQRSHGLHR